MGRFYFKLFLKIYSTPFHSAVGHITRVRIEAYLASRTEVHLAAKFLPLVSILKRCILNTFRYLLHFMLAMCQGGQPSPFPLLCPWVVMLFGRVILRIFKGGREGKESLVPSKVPKMNCVTVVFLDIVWGV